MRLQEGGDIGAEVELGKRGGRKEGSFQENDLPEDGATSSRVYKGCLATRRSSWAERVRNAPSSQNQGGLR